MTRHVIGSVSRGRVSAKVTIEQYAKELMSKSSPENASKLSAIATIAIRMNWFPLAQMINKFFQDLNRQAQHESR